MSIGFVGREQQLGVAGDQLLNARAGRPEPMLITGESGAGKSMFLERVAEAADEAGFRVFRVDGESPTTTGPHRALAAAVAQWAKDRPDAATSALALHVGSRAATSWLPLADRRLAIIDALRHFFEGVSARTPVLLAIDDLHLIDDDSADATLFLMRHLRRHRVLVVGTWRTDVAVDNTLSDDLQRALANGHLLPVALGPFDGDELTALVHSRTGTVPTAAFIEALQARTGGMPFFAAELVDAMAAHPSSGSGGDDTIELALPRRVATTVLHRVFALGADARQVATVVALLGWIGIDRLPTLAVVTTMTDERAEDAFDRLVRARVLVPDGDSYRFTHAIVRDALLADTHPARRRRLHRLIARTLADERRAGAHRDIEEIGDHLRRGVAGHDRAAAALLVEAGDAVVFETPASAASWYREALVRLPPDHPDAAVTQVRLSRALSLQGRHVEASKVATAALARLPLGDARSDAVVIAAHAALVTGALESAAQLLDIAPGVASSSHRMVLGAVVDTFQASPADAIRITEGAVADGAPGHDPTVLAMLAAARAGTGDFESAARLTRDLRASSPSRPPDGRLRAALHACLLSAVEFEPRDALGDAGAADRGGPLAGWFLSAASWAHLRMGHLDDAVAAGESARASIDPAVGDVFLELTVPALVIAHLERHAVPEAEEVAAWAATVPVFTAGTGLRVATARVHAAHDELDRAVEVLREALDIEAARGRHNIVSVLYAELIELAVAADDAVAARAANDRLQALPRSRSAIAMNMRCLLSDALCRRTSDLAVAAGHYASRHGLELDAARALAIDGEIRRDADLLSAANTALARLGAVTRQRQVAAQLRAIGRRGGRDRDHGPLLSATEAAVSALVAEGLTNRQVGAHMGLSPKTIEVYLSRIYAKTGCRSRVELAVAVRDGTLPIPA